MWKVKEMPGIIVGVDGSGHSQRALEWAMKEAAVRQVPLTVMTVHELLRGYFGGTVTFPDDPALAVEAGQQVQAEVDKTLAESGEAVPPSVTVRVASGSIVEELVNASKDADMLVVGSRGAGGFARMMLGSVSSLVAQHAICPLVIIPPADRE
jgi:nucleotide-binding universal stress UspA family protein